MAGRTQAAGAQDPAPPDDRHQLREQHPDSWIPIDPGDTLRGRLVDVQDAWSDQRQGGSFYPLLIIRAAKATGYEIEPGPNGGLELKVHAFGAVLYNEVMRRQPQVGEVVTITYEGERPPTAAALERNPDLSPSKLYKLEVDGRQDQAAGVYAKLGRQPE